MSRTTSEPPAGLAIEASDVPDVELSAPVSPDPHRHADLVNAPLRRTVIMLALPVLGEQLLNATVGVFDVFLAGTFHADATAAVGVAAYVGWLASMLFMLVGTGTTALVARLTGAGDRAGADRVANQSITLGAIVGIVVCLVIYASAHYLTIWQNFSGRRYDITLQYLRIDALGYLFTSVTLVGAAALRGVGDMRTLMLILAVVSATNVVASSALVFGFGPIESIGVTGIVVGTLIARVVGALVTCWVLFGGWTRLRFAWSLLAPCRETATRVLRIGLPAAVDGLVMWTGHFLFLGIVGRLGSEPYTGAAFAAHVIGIRVEGLTYLPAVAYGYACATLVGQALGAGQIARAKQVAHEAVTQCMAIAVGIGVLLFTCAGPIFRMMSADELVGTVGPPAMRLVAFFQPCLAVSIVYIWALRGAGDTRSPMWITLASATIVRLPAAYLLGIVLEGGLIGAWIGMCGDMLVRAVLAAWRHRQGRWAQVKV